MKRCEGEGNGPGDVFARPGPRGGGMGMERWIARHRVLALTLMALMPGGVLLGVLLPWLARRR